MYILLSKGNENGKFVYSFINLILLPSKYLLSLYVDIYESGIIVDDKEVFTVSIMKVLLLEICL